MSPEFQAFNLKATTQLDLAGMQLSDTTTQAKCQRQKVSVEHLAT